MPELPEVETVKNALKEQVLNRKIIDTKIFYPNIIEYPTIQEFQQEIQNQTICDIQRRGKWLIFVLDSYYLFSHLRMEGKYYIKERKEEYSKHEHIAFLLDNEKELRYHDTRKFGRMHLLLKETAHMKKPLNELGLEPWDETLNESYLKEKYQNKNIPIKTALLDQSIITGIGNIYADEILFLSHIHPLKRIKDLTKKERENIIKNTKEVLEKAIEKGGTTIRTYTSVNGIHGLFQLELYVHNKKMEPCPICGTPIEKIVVNTRGTYYCKKCQKK